MKIGGYILWISLVAFTFSCKKKHEEHKESKVCNNSFVAWKKLPGDSLMLIQLDTLGNNTGSTLYPHVKYWSLCFNKKDRCVYSMQWNDSTRDMYLYRFDLKNKKTDILTYSGTPFSDNAPGSWTFFYNSVLDKFYLSYYDYRNSHHYLDATYELSISGSTFTVIPISVLSQYHVAGEADIDERNGDIYFSRQSIKYTPATNTATTVPLDTVSSYYFGYGKLFNPNDGIFYGLQTQSSPNVIEFWKFDVDKGVATKITNLPTSLYNGIRYGTFDACNNQYIIQQVDANTNIYWLNVKDGSIVKQVSLSGAYKSLTYIPE